MSAWPVLLLGAALLTAPAPVPRPASPPEPADPGLDQLLEEVRRIHGRGTAPSAPEPPAAATATSGETPAPGRDGTEGENAAPALPAPGPVDAAGSGAPAAAPPPPPAPRAAGQGTLGATPPGPGGDVPAATDPSETAAGGPPAPEAGAPLPVDSADTGAGALPAAAAPAPATAPLPEPPPRPADDPAVAASVVAVPAAERDEPDPLPDRVAPAMTPGVRAPLRPQVPKQLVCRDPRLSGTAIPQILHESWPCGIALPVRINSVVGTRLSSPATLDCNTAGRFATWLTGVVEHAAREHLGSGVERVWVMGSYACRRRNNMPAGKLSEHARGRAIDIGGVWLEDGRKVTLAEHWGKGAEGRFLKQIRARACGLFKTVLGPGSDRHHADHLHLDTSPRGGDPYCK